MKAVTARVNAVKRSDTKLDDMLHSIRMGNQITRPHLESQLVIRSPNVTCITRVHIVHTFHVLGCCMACNEKVRLSFLRVCQAHLFHLQWRFQHNWNLVNFKEGTAINHRLFSWKYKGWVVHPFGKLVRPSMASINASLARIDFIRSQARIPYTHRHKNNQQTKNSSKWFLSIIGKLKTSRYAQNSQYLTTCSTTK